MDLITKKISKCRFYTTNFHLKIKPAYNPCDAWGQKEKKKRKINKTV
jgi:hypothetical protein